MKKVVYPGSFDPPTLGHMNVAEQMLKVFDEVFITVVSNPSKVGMFTIEEKLEMLEELYKDNDRVHIITGEGATVDIVLEQGCCAIARGLRGFDDISDELALATVNRLISNKKVETVAFFSEPEYQHISSSVTKQVFALGKNIDSFVDPLVKRKMLVKRNGS